MRNGIRNIVNHIMAARKSPFFIPFEPGIEGHTNAYTSANREPSDSPNILAAST